MSELLSTLLFAETRFSELNLEFKEAPIEQAQSYWIWFVVGLVICVIVIGWRIRTASQKKPIGPSSMLGELCGAHRINAEGSRLLQLIATRAQLEQPAVLFLGETIFDEALERAAEEIPFKPDQEKCIAMVRRRLFETEMHC